MDAKGGGKKDIALVGKLTNPLTSNSLLQLFPYGHHADLLPEVLRLLLRYAECPAPALHVPWILPHRLHAFVEQVYAISQRQRCDIEVIEHLPEFANVSDLSHLNKAVFVARLFGRRRGVRALLVAVLTVMPEIPSVNEWRWT